MLFVTGPKSFSTAFTIRTTEACSCLSPVVLPINVCSEPAIGTLLETLPGISEQVAGQYNALVHSVAAPLLRTVQRTATTSANIII